MTEWVGYKNYDHYYRSWLTHEISAFFTEIKETEPELLIDGNHHVWNIPCAFDIETSSYKVFGEKRATMYIWSLTINGSTIIGRRWDQFTKIINLVAKNMHTEENNLIIYCHNLGYEFQWMRKWLQWKEVFAVKERRPIRAELTNGIIFKCSYLLSNYALAYIGDKLIKKYLIKKDVGAVDYSLVRSWVTPLSETEIWYNIHDNQVVTSYIQEKIENEGGIINIPLTNTGYVRQYCRNFCFNQGITDVRLAKKVKAQYKERMESLQITSECEYDTLHEAFAGGFTHGAPSYSGQTISGNIGSADLASSYPAVMVTKKFPMGRGTFLGNISVEQMEELAKSGNFCAVFTIHLRNVTPKFIYEHYISVSHCQILSKDAVVNNGRVAAASEMQLVVTDIDWGIIKNVYDFTSVEIHNYRVYQADYLPRPFILSILHLFANKTSLKGVDGKETEYMVSKNMINAAYGMSVTAVIRDIFDYSHDCWSTHSANKVEQLEKYNSNYNRFLFYAWGVWVTAYARANLWQAIFEFGKDYVYADTDSIKGLNFDKHQVFFKLYNLNIYNQLQKMCQYWKINFELCQPKTVKGEKKLIGVWEIEKPYVRFKTLGAKRYMFEYADGFINFTISGVQKRVGMPYLLSEYAGVDIDKALLAYKSDDEEDSINARNEIIEAYKNGEYSYDDIFENFNESLYFPAEYTGKQTLAYLDDSVVDICTDYRGKSVPIMELSSIHMEPQSYYLSQAITYKEFLQGYRDASI